ncbi:MAG: right-handed parallel beta-helix repeat-containing protein, partial [Candidatus Cloacimonetes bacterium]|nr:right-handed parallel beta-helix repeat-containing protein [Candidatus Cloacimonadota bacterium]
MNNVQFVGNRSGSRGGGIFIQSSSTLNMEDVTVSHNESESGGGIYVSFANLNFSPSLLCNIHSNFAASGNDIYTTNAGIIDIYLNTFSVLLPNDYYAHPIENFSFIEILQGLETQEDADLYVNSFYGNDDNSGLTDDLPLKSIEKALRKIIASSRTPRTIHLAGGMYSNGFSAERFPLNARDFVSLSGASVTNTILDGGGERCVIYCEGDDDFTIENMKIQNGWKWQGGGLYLTDDSDPTLTNVEIRLNSANSGGGMYCDSNSSPIINNVYFTENTAEHGGGGIYISSSSPSFSNTIINNNHSNNDGGGLYLLNCIAINMNNVIITGNTADNNGDGIYFEDSYIFMTNSILTDNVYEYSYSLENYINNNRILDITYSNIPGGTGTNIDVDPMFFDPINGIYHLDPGSPCVDAGNPDPAYNDPEDPENLGFALFPALGTIICDMGSYGGPGSTEWENEGIVLLPPENVTICVIDNSLEISWDTVIWATSYKVYASDEPYITFTDEISSYEG